MAQILSHQTKLLRGHGKTAEVGHLLHQLGVKRVLVVTDPGIVAAGLVERVVHSLSTHQMPFFIFDEVEPNPSLQTAELIALVYEEQNCSGMVAIGGGSPMDAAKGAGILVSNYGELLDYADGGEIANKLPPLVAIPTTVGTGSEVTRFAVLTDPDACQKLNFTSDLLIPEVAILDPELVESLPAQIVAATGMDALTHAIESMLSVFADPSSDALAKEAIELITQHLLTAASAESRSEAGKTARAQMLYASTLAGFAFSYTLLGLVHGMSHPLTSYYGVPHGLANAVLLPHVLRFNAPACLPALARVAQAMGKASHAEAAIDAVEELNRKLNIPMRLSEVGVSQDFIPEMAEEAFASGNAQIVNPRKPTLEEIVALYQQLL